MEPKRKKEPYYEDPSGKMKCPVPSCRKPVFYYIKDGHYYLSCHINPHQPYPCAICPGTDADMGEVEEAV